MSFKYYDLIIIGAGASGCVAAITASQRGKSVLLLEKNPSIGKKILATGNGKCNFTNRLMSTDCYHGDLNQITNMLNELQPIDVIEFFHSLGILAVEKNGYVYPASGQAKSVVRAFEQKLYQLGVDVKCDTKVNDFRKVESGFQVYTASKEQYCCTNLLVFNTLINCGKAIATNPIDPITETINNQDHLPVIMSINCFPISIITSYPSYFAF